MSNLEYPNIEAERVRNQITRAKMAEELGVSEKTYYNYLRGAPIPAPVLIAMARKFDTSVDYLLGLAPRSTAQTEKSA